MFFCCVTLPEFHKTCNMCKDIWNFVQSNSKKEPRSEFVYLKTQSSALANTNTNQNRGIAETVIHLQYSSFFTVLLVTGWTTRVQFPAGADYVSPSHPVLGPTEPIHCISVALSPGVKTPRCETDHSPPSSAEAKIPWRYTSTP
jgi:hypothetical protein